MSFYMIPLGPSGLLSICLILFPSVWVFLSSASVLRCLYINAEAFKKPFSKDQKPAVSLNQSILGETVGGRRLSTWTRGYGERMQRLSLLNQRLWPLISWDSLLWWCHTDTSTPELFFALYWNFSLPSLQDKTHAPTNGWALRLLWNMRLCWSSRIW